MVLDHARIILEIRWVEVIQVAERSRERDFFETAILRRGTFTKGVCRKKENNMKIQKKGQL